MSIDVLQTKMKKQSNTLMLNCSFSVDSVPAALREVAACDAEAIRLYGKQLLAGLKGKICAARFSLLHYALMGETGISTLTELMQSAASMGYYTLLDIPGVMTLEMAEFGAKQTWGENTVFPCDGILVSGYPGSDVIKPFLPFCEQQKKDLFVVVRSPNRSALEVQDLVTGSRTVHTAAADNVNRYRAGSVGKNTYSRVAIAVAATSADSVKMLRLKYPGLFMLVDGMELPGGNAKNCSYAFDRMGHGAICCVGQSVIEAWKNAEGDYIQAALDEAVKAQKRIDRYVTVL